MKILGKIRNLLLFVILAGGLAWAWQEGKLAPVIKTGREIIFGKPPQKPTAKDFKFQSVTRQDVHQKVLATGTVTLKTGAEVKIGARISGLVKNLLVKIGDFIHAGEIIAIIEHEDLLSRVARFQADLDAEKARQAKIRAEGPLEINTAIAEREELRVQIKLAQKMLERNQELNQKGFVSNTVVDQAEEKLAVLKARINLAGEELKLEQSQVQNDSRLAQAMVERAQASLAEEEIQLSYATITAPIDGIVAFVSTQEGETVVASLSAPEFVTLIDLRKLEVTVFVDETDIGRIKVGQIAKFTVDTYADQFFKGKVREIHPKAVIKENVVNYEVILDIEKKKLAKLRPEMTANVVVTTGTRKKVVTLPKEAVKREGKKTFVVTQNDGKLKDIPIELGWRDGGRIEVTSGLNEGDEVGIPNKPLKKKRRGRRP
ncbi:MAG: efflux RND transporter periplasmic adaptor subunit [Nitrospina sp.]|jgi:multidrug resistance efflux pump|nr:efflux RND transporter periplasmic adaptor subunit [Nitrospina sp.]MBT3511273.1 efflux RND transporter periplasmic adaptor subunit [Nitrospina sp.]MBT3877128.1 efflux RND transporter periplasmic adaptor subunit [Nitrospina sp.]MBT4047503.1 efflux RND transporter periplasmic adaptor subunit [Nitrospina sp.]MBT4558140.1 efflux RND transporter periplasmic adaptor subunit [Nitrospina sp.]